MHEKRWSQEKAALWYEKQPWLVGCNFIPSTAVNQLEMWQEATFDVATMDRELSWAAELGFNTVRVYLHDLAWEADADGFKVRIDHYLESAESHGISTMFVLFDDCWNNNPQPGPQPEPVPGVHNSGWVQSPGSRLVVDSSTWARLEYYVTDIVAAFGDDERVLLWDLYNEPGNNGLGAKSLPLLRKAFEWARSAAPTQPLTVAVWTDNRELNTFQLGASDIITFHNYLDAESLSQQVQDLKALGRPLICSEYMARTLGSRFETHLPIFKREKVGCYCWGLVSGRTQTMYQWGSDKGSPEPDVWFHDILRKDGTPFDSQEVQLIRRLTLAE